MPISMSQQSITIDGNSRMYLQDGTQGPGKILMSDANGSLSWKSTIPNRTFTYVTSIFQRGQYTTLNVSALPFRHYFTIGERDPGDGGHIINLPTAPTEGDMIRVTNTSLNTNYIYIGSSTHTIFYWTNMTIAASTTVAAGSFLALRMAQTIEVTFANKNPLYPSPNTSARPTVDRWYVTNLCSIDDNTIL